MVERERLQMYFFLGLIAVFAILSYMLVAPYVFYLIGAVLLVYIAYPLYEQVEARTDERVAAGITILVLLVAAVLPTIWLAGEVVTQGNRALVSVGTQASEFIELDRFETEVARFTGEQVDVERTVREAFVTAGNLVSTELPGIISTVVDALIGVFLMGITMYYLFKDGPALVASVRDLVPLEEYQEGELVDELDRMAEAILVGHLLTAAVQGVVAGAGLYIVGIPNAVFWTFIMIVLGLIPLVGNFLVWGPAGIYLVATGSPVAGVGLLVYATVTMVALDNLVRARVVGKRSDIHPLLVMIGVIGGLPMFGMLGVVLGPLLLGFFTTLLGVYREDFLPED